MREKSSREMPSGLRAEGRVGFLWDGAGVAEAEGSERMDRTSAEFDMAASGRRAGLHRAGDAPGRIGAPKRALTTRSRSLYSCSYTTLTRHELAEAMSDADEFVDIWADSDPVEFHRNWSSLASAKFAGPHLQAVNALRKIYPDHSIVGTHSNVLKFPAVVSSPLPNAPQISNITFIPQGRVNGQTKGALAESIEFGAFTAAWDVSARPLFNDVDLIRDRNTILSSMPLL